MKIDKVAIRKLSGVMDTNERFWEERLVMPLDVYPDFRVTNTREPGHAQDEQQDDKHYYISACFVEIATNDGAIGIAGPFDELVGHIIARQIRPLLLGRNAFAIEYLWDIMHRALVHGRQGTPMFAISAVDCALWDLKGRSLGVPVYSLIGGPTRDEIPAYASMLGYAVEDMGLVRERAKMVQSQGYTAQKWFFRHGPMSGSEGFKLNVAMVKTLRETLGDDYDIMLDCWQSMNLTYASKLANAIEEYEPRWLEEAGMPDRIDTYRQLRERTSIPISGAEHEYTRWGFRRFIEAEALDILQPDIYWCGGLSETLKIATLATTYDLITIPHGHSTPAGIHFSVSQSPIHTPYQEYLLKWNEVHQFFLKHPLRPQNGNIMAPSTPGMNMDLDETKIDSEEEFMP